MGLRCLARTDAVSIPEDRGCAAPTTARILESFAGVARHQLTDTDGTVLRTFHPQLTDLQRHILDPLDIPTSVYRPVTQVPLKALREVRKDLLSTSEACSVPRPGWFRWRGRRTGSCGGRSSACCRGWTSRATPARSFSRDRSGQAARPGLTPGLRLVSHEPLDGEPAVLVPGVRPVSDQDLVGCCGLILGGGAHGQQCCLLFRR